MWLAGAFPFIARFATRTFYRLTFTGERVPATGPVLLVANHPNSLLDPFLVIAAAGRPVRFLAKAPLFDDPAIGWGVHAVGAIPVYRTKDDPAQVFRNKEMFGAVHQALADGHAVGLFPEGISHHEPHLVPLKTGAARIALGAAPLVGSAFPIVPVGSVFERKHTFRTRAYVTIGPPIQWEDLVAHGLHDGRIVRMLTQRIQTALREITVNLERWEDAPIVEAAETIYAAEFSPVHEPAEQIERLQMIAHFLSSLRAAGNRDAEELGDAILAHAESLGRLGLTPQDLHQRTDTGTAVRWTFTRAPVTGILPAIVTLLGTLVFWTPYKANRILVKRLGGNVDMVATYKMLGGAVLFFAWIVLLAAVAGVTFGWVAGIVVLFALPVLAIATLAAEERWGDAWGDVRRFFVLRSQRATVADLRARQRKLAERLRDMWER